ncbi:MAG: hypothetical protein HFJ38_00695 [Bacilli bacterium]|nr:hypothetical protein [Bacilli bacterium]
MIYGDWVDFVSSSGSFSCSGGDWYRGTGAGEISTARNTGFANYAYGSRLEYVRL